MSDAAAAFDLTNPPTASLCTDSFHLNRNPLLTVQLTSHRNTSEAPETERGTALHCCVQFLQLWKWPRVRRPRGEEFNCFAVGWDRKWSFHRRGTVCYRTAALERSPDRSQSRLKNKATSHSSTLYFPEMKPEPVTVPHKQKYFGCLMWLNVWQYRTQACSRFPLLSKVKWGQARSSSHVRFYLVIGFKIRHNNTGPCGFKLQALQKGVIMQTNCPLTTVRARRPKPSQQLLPDAAAQVCIAFCFVIIQ